MKIIYLFLLLLSFGAQGQKITYTPMAQAGYGFRYQLSDSGNAMPFRNLSVGRGTERPGPVVVNIADTGFYYYNGIQFIRLDGKVDSVTSSGNNVCQWKRGVPKCYLLNTGGSTFIGIDSVTYSGNSICQWKNGIPICYSVIPGVDSVVIHGSQLCQWKAGTPICYTINGDILGVGIDSVTVNGNTLCQWKSGAAICYTINSVTNGIDSLTVNDSLLCSWSAGISTCFIIGHEDTVFLADDLVNRGRTATNKQIIGRLHSDGIVTGGIVTSSGCLTIQVVPTGYYLNNGTHYQTALTTLTVTPDPSLATTFGVILDTFGVATLRAGTPSLTPQSPSFNPASEWLLTTFTVEGGATCLDININVLYDETGGTEYTPSTSGTITSNVSDIANPEHLTKADFVSSYADGAKIIFTKPSGVDTVFSNSVFKFFLYLNGELLNHISLQLFNGATTISNDVLLDPYLNASDSNEYQVVATPSYALGLTGGGIFDKLVFTLHGSDLSGAKGFYLDYLQLQTGLIQPGKFYVDSVTIIDGSDYYWINGIATLIGVRGGEGVTANNGLTVNSGSNVQLGGTLLQNTTVDLNGHQILLGNNLEIHSAVDNEFATLGVINETGVTKGSDIAAHSDADGSDVYLESVYDNGAKSGLIELHTDATTSTAEYTADSHEFTGTLEFNTVASGTTTDSVLTIDPDTKIVTWRNAASFGGQQNLQQVTTIGNTTPLSMYSADSIKAYSMYSSGGGMFGDSSALSPADTTVSYGASPELGAFVATGYPVTVGSNLNTFPLVKAISGTSFQKISTGDSSMVDRIYTIPVYRSTERDLFIGGGSFLNDYQFAIGTGGLAAAINKVIDTAHIARGWPLNRIVLVSPSIFGTHLYPAVVGASKTNDSLRIYSNVAIAAAKAKGILYVDAFTYMSNNGGATLVQADSIHPTQTGQYEISEAVTYRISDVKVNNSLRVQRDFLAKGNGFFGKIVTFADSVSTTGGNFVGRINWGARLTAGAPMDAITFYNGGTTSLIAGVGITAAAQTVFMARGSTEGLFTVGQNATTATKNNSNFYISPSTTPTPLNLSLSTVFNGDAWFYNAKPTILTFAAVSGGTNNAVNPINFGNTTATQGIYTLDAGSSTLKAGLIYKSTGTSFLIGRGSFPFYAAVGSDETNTTSSNAAFGMTSSNTFFENGGITNYVAKTTAFTATPKNNTIDYPSGTVTVSLPSAIPISGAEYTIKNSGVGTITVQANPNGIATLGAITGGSGYVNGVYPNVTLTGGTGSVNFATVTVSGGAVTAVTITTSGRDYTVADNLSALTANIGGGAGSGFSVPVATLVSETIDGSNTYPLTVQYQVVKIQSTGGHWIVIGH